MNYDITINCKDLRLVDNLTKSYTSCNVLNDSDSFAYIVNDVSSILPCSVQSMLESYPSLISKNSMETKLVNVSHTIDTGNAAPTFTKQRRLSPQKEAAAKSEFQNLLSAGIIRQSKSPC